MSADIFSKSDAYNLLCNKQILMFGDSNMRAIYKDLTWLIEEGTLIPKTSLQTKNERHHANDIRISNGQLTASRDYKEIRQYNHKVFIHYEFITRLYMPDFIKAIENLQHFPEALIINSCLWDLSRWGPNGVDDYKTNVVKTMQFLQTKLKNHTRVIWTTTLPPSFKCRGGFLSKENDFIRMTLPFHIVEANKYMTDCALKFGFDVLDLHYHLRFLIDSRSRDGIHWEPHAVRYITNFLLTHLALSWHKRLPGNVTVDFAFLKRSGKSVHMLNEKLELLDRVACRLQKDGLNNGAKKNCNVHQKQWNHFPGHVPRHVRNKHLDNDGYDYSKDYYF